MSSREIERSLAAAVAAAGIAAMFWWPAGSETPAGPDPATEEAVVEEVVEPVVEE